MKPAATALASVLGAVALAGCGLGAGPTPSAVKLVVTSDFGARVLPATGPLKANGQVTVMSLLTRNYRVATREAGGFVDSIDGLSGGQQAGAPVDWFYYVNGVEATGGAATIDVRSGDHIWWDRHDWSQTETIPAVVGSFPEPFENGIAGKRLPVRVECVSVAGYACRTVTARLRALNIPVASAQIGSKGGSESLRVLVAPWVNVASDPGATGLQHGPRASGVYARFSASGQALTLLDQNGGPVETLRTGAGLIAATRRQEDPPVWLVTGTDGQGVALAARAFDQGTLQDRFAVALGPEGAVALPDGMARR
jgi:Domain of unknown function (DUF4430)